MDQFNMDWKLADEILGIAKVATGVALVKSFPNQPNETYHHND